MIVLLSIVFVLSIILTFYVKKFAEKKSIVDIPNERSSHTIQTPRGGGIAITISWFIGISYLYFAELIDPNLYYAFLGGIPLMIIGVIDDVTNVKPLLRLLVQAFSAIWALYFLGGLIIIDFGFFTFTNIYIASIFAFLLILWFVNLFNFIDGIDGYLSTGIIIFSIPLFILSNNFSVLILTASVLGFLIWNWQPAKIFMGDVGSTILGFNFIIFTLYFQNIKEVPMIIPMLLSSVFWFDATYTLIRRWVNKEKISEAHKKHAYQRLNQAGFSHQKVVIFSVLLNIIIIGIVILSVLFPKLILLMLFIVLLILFIVMRLIEHKKPF